MLIQHQKHAKNNKIVLFVLSDQESCIQTDRLISFNEVNTFSGNWDIQFTYLSKKNIMLYPEYGTSLYYVIL
jgi:hypothetical protein